MSMALEGQLAASAASGRTGDGDEASQVGRAPQSEKLCLSFGGVTYEGFLCYQRDLRRPLVLILPNVEGLNSFDEGQAMFLAELGFTGLAIDLYGHHLPRRRRNFLTTQSNPEEMEHAFNMMNYWTSDVGNLRKALAAWLEVGRQHHSVDPSSCAAIGYCFGGLCCLEMVRAGLPVSGVVSFHGVLQPRVFSPPGRPVTAVPATSPMHTKGAKVLIENGEKDHLVPALSIEALEKEMAEAGIDLQIHHHKGAGHGFALPGQSFHCQADKAATWHMIDLLRDIFPQVDPCVPERNFAGTSLRW